MRIDLLVVPDCPHESAAADLIWAAVTGTRVRANVIRTVVRSLEQAQPRGFIGSPTILRDGIDPFAVPDAPVALACRLYTTPDGMRGLPALPDLRRALKRAAAS